MTRKLAAKKRPNRRRHARVAARTLYPLSHQLQPATAAIRAIKQGLRFETWEKLRQATGLSKDRLAKITGIDPSTLRRRKRSGRLDPHESERVERIARIFDMTVRLFAHNEDLARDWLNTPDSSLHGATPLEYCETEIGAGEVEDLIGRIEHGAVA